MRANNFDLSLNTPYGIGLMIACFVVLTLEFFKSGDISLRAYMADQTFAIIALAAVSVMSTVIIKRGEPLLIIDWLLIAVCCIDAWLCPVNSFRTALRNLQTSDVVTGSAV